MSVSYLCFGATVSTSLRTLGRYAVVLATSGRCVIRADGQEVVVDQRRAAMLSVSADVVETLWWPDSGVVVFTVDPPGIEGRAGELRRALLRSPVAFDLELDLTTRGGRRLKHGVLLPVIRELERAHDPTNDVALIERLQSTVIDGLLRHER